MRDIVEVVRKGQMFWRVDKFQPPPRAEPSVNNKIHNFFYFGLRQSISCFRMLGALDRSVLLHTRWRWDNIQNCQGHFGKWRGAIESSPPADQGKFLAPLNHLSGLVHWSVIKGGMTQNLLSDFLWNYQSYFVFIRNLFSFSVTMCVRTITCRTWAIKGKSCTFPNMPLT